MTRLSLLATPLLLILSACATSISAAAPPMSDPMPPLVQTCNAELAKPGAMGRRATAEVIDQARIDAGARTARVLKPGQMVTMEYLEGRLNIDVDDDNLIVNLRCG